MPVTQIKYIVNPGNEAESISEDQQYKWLVRDETGADVPIWYQATAGDCVKIVDEYCSDGDYFESDWVSLQEFIKSNDAVQVPEVIELSKYNHAQQRIIHRFLGQLRKQE